MPRANRRFVPGIVWHITHRCHDRAFLLKAAADRDTWRYWLWKARTRYGLCVLDYITTSNHVHLLAFDEHGERTIARSMQLIQGRTAQAHNRRRNRKGAYWQDRYHAVAVDTEEYLWRCLVYVDLNMVRAGVVSHPAQWSHGGYSEIQRPRSRYRVIDLERLAWLLGCGSVGRLQANHRERVAESLASEALRREPSWTEAIAVGGDRFVETVRVRLGLTRLRRTSADDDAGHALRTGSAR